MLLNLSRDESRFRLGIQRLVVTNLFAGGILGPQRFFFALDVVFDDAAGHIQDILRRAIVLFEANDFCRLKVFFEFQDVRDVGAAPAID